MQIIYRLYPNALHCSAIWTQFSSAIVTFLWIFNAAHWNLQLLQCMTLEVVFGHSASVHWNIESNTERKLLINFLPRPQATLHSWGIIIRPSSSSWSSSSSSWSSSSIDHLPQPQSPHSWGDGPVTQCRFSLWAFQPCNAPHKCSRWKPVEINFFCKFTFRFSMTTHCY